MKRKTIRRGLAALLCMAMLLSIPAMAVFEEDEIQEIPVVSETDVVAELPKVPVEAPFDDGSLGEQAQPMAATVESFSVTLPTNLSARLNADGSRTMGAAKITNNGLLNIMVTDVSCQMADGWTLRDYMGTESSTLPVGEKSVAMSIKQQGCSNASVSKDGALQYGAGSFSQVSYGNSAVLDYNVLVPAQIEAATAKVMDVAFVVRAFHNYSFSVVADHGTIEENSFSYMHYDTYAPNEWFSNDTFTVTICDNGIAMEQDIYSSVSWYYLDGNLSDVPNFSNGAYYSDSGQNATIGVDIYGMSAARFVKVCWHEFEYIFIIPTRGQ